MPFLKFSRDLVNVETRSVYQLIEMLVLIFFALSRIMHILNFAYIDGYPIFLERHQITPVSLEYY